MPESEERARITERDRALPGIDGDRKDSAIAGIAIVILVLVVAIIVVLIVLVLLINPFIPGTIPQFTATAERSGNAVYLTHTGGDPVYRQAARFTVNDQNIPDDEIVILHNQPWPWSSGETIKITWSGPETPDTVAIYDTRGLVAAPVYAATIIPPPTPPSPPPPVALTPAANLTTTAPTPTNATTRPTPTPTTAATTPALNTTATATPGFTRTLETPGTLTARFEAIPSTGPAPLTVTFHDLSSGVPSAWNWDFGDGTNSVVRSPQHTYTAPGSYAATLAVSNPVGNDRTTTPVTITVTGGATAALTWRTAPGQVPYTIAFKGEATGTPESWEWDFGDGFTMNGQEALHTYSGPGTYTVTLTVTAGGSMATAEETITLLPGTPPRSAFEVSPASGPAPLEVRFRDTSTGSPTSWEWDFGDGSAGIGPAPIHVYTSPGRYTVTLTVANAFGRDTRMVSAAVKVS